MSKINIKLRHFPGCVPMRVMIAMIEGRLVQDGPVRDGRRSKVYKKVRRMNEKARMKEQLRRELPAMGD